MDEFSGGEFWRKVERRTFIELDVLCPGGYVSFDLTPFKFCKNEESASLILANASHIHYFGPENSVTGGLCGFYWDTFSRKEIFLVGSDFIELQLTASREPSTVFSFFDFRGNYRS